MSAVAKPQYVSVDDYLGGELVSQVKHEYLGGLVYAVAGAQNVHSLIASNILGSLHGQLRSKPCRPYNSDTKIRVNSSTHVDFYYPDVSVVCDSNPPDDSFQERPVVIVEVVSEKTRRTDYHEKKNAYLSIPSLAAYLLVEQDFAAANVFRRTEQGFVQEAYAALDATIPLKEIGAVLPLADVYEGVKLASEPEEEA